MTTVTVHEARARVTACILAEMADEHSAASLTPQSGAWALAFLAELQPDLRAAAIFGWEGELIASSTEAGPWLGPATRLLEAADTGSGGPALEVHVATPTGEVFAVREGAQTAVAVTERYVLASLLIFDMRTVLRQAVGGTK